MNILDQIKECEQQAADIRLKATAQARDIVRDAERSGEDQAAQILEQAREKCEQLLAQKDAESKQAAEQYIQDQAKLDTNQIKKYEPNTGLAVQRIVEGVVRL